MTLTSAEYPASKAYNCMNCPLGNSEVKERCRVRSVRACVSVPEVPASWETFLLIRTLRLKSPEANGPSPPAVPCCEAHRRPCVLRVVRKEGENTGRHFYACSLPREAQCQFFEVRQTGERVTLSLKEAISHYCQCEFARVLRLVTCEYILHSLLSNILDVFLLTRCNINDNSNYNTTQLY